jgi:hypothetical protein
MSEHASSAKTGPMIVTTASTHQMVALPSCVARASALEGVRINHTQYLVETRPQHDRAYHVTADRLADEFWLVRLRSMEKNGNRLVSK